MATGNCNLELMALINLGNDSLSVEGNFLQYSKFVVIFMCLVFKLFVVV